MNLNPFKKEASIDTKRVFKSPQFSIILPPGWIIDPEQKKIITIYRKKGDSGVLQISTFSKNEKKRIDPKFSLQNNLKDNKIKINTYSRNNSDYAITDYYIKEKTFWKMMVVDNDEKHALITYNIEEEFKNAYLKDVDEIFDSFMFEN